MSEAAPAFVAATPPPVHFLTRLGFGFALVYLLLYGLPFPLGPVPAQDDKWPVESAAKAIAGWTGGDPERLPHYVSYPDKWHKEYSEELEQYVVWFGDNVLGSMFEIGEVAPVQTGSGDTLFDWVRVALLLAIALLVAPLGALILHRRRAFDWCNGVIRVYVRYALASTLCGYGFAKLFPLQFPALAGEQLYGSYGDASPMNMLWSFMGASEPYTIFAGAAEVLGGLLLLFRRTTTLGALVAITVMTNVMVLNFCYDVPVKLFSAHLVLFAGFLLAGDAGRLWSMFFSHRAMPARRLRMPVPMWVLVPWFALKLTVGGCIVGVPLYSSYHSWQEQQAREPGLLEGIWEARDFSSTAPDGATLPAAEHWHHITIQYWPQNGETRCVAGIRDLSGKQTQALVEWNVEAATLRMPRQNQEPIELSYEERSQLVEGRELPVRQLVLSGTVDGRDLRAVLDHRDEATFRLNSTGFQWIQERPVNRNRR